MSKFLNRILGISVEIQNHLFLYFTDTLAAVVLQAKRNGRWDMGILGGSRDLENCPVVCQMLHIACPKPEFQPLFMTLCMHKGGRTKIVDSTPVQELNNLTPY